mgnify:CR=1 FL=1
MGMTNGKMIPRIGDALERSIGNLRILRNVINGGKGTSIGIVDPLQILEMLFLQWMVQNIRLIVMMVLKRAPKRKADAQDLHH